MPTSHGQERRGGAAGAGGRGRRAGCGRVRGFHRRAGFAAAGFEAPPAAGAGLEAAAAAARFTATSATSSASRWSTVSPGARPLGAPDGHPAGDYGDGAEADAPARPGPLAPLGPPRSRSKSWTSDAPTGPPRSNSWNERAPWPPEADATRPLPRRPKPSPRCHPGPTRPTALPFQVLDAQHPQQASTLQLLERARTLAATPDPPAPAFPFQVLDTRRPQQASPFQLLERARTPPQPPPARLPRRSHAGTNGCARPRVCQPASHFLIGRPNKLLISLATRGDDDGNDDRAEPRRRRRKPGRRDTAAHDAGRPPPGPRPARGHAPPPVDRARPPVAVAHPVRLAHRDLAHRRVARRAQLGRELDPLVALHDDARRRRPPGRRRRRPGRRRTEGSTVDYLTTPRNQRGVYGVLVATPAPPHGRRRRRRRRRAELPPVLRRSRVGHGERERRRRGGRLLVAVPRPHVPVAGQRRVRRVRRRLGLVPGQRRRRRARRREGRDLRRDPRRRGHGGVVRRRASWPCCSAASTSGTGRACAAGRRPS